MESEYKTIYEFDNSLIYDYYINLERQGPDRDSFNLYEI